MTIVPLFAFMIVVVARALTPGVGVGDGVMLLNSLRRFSGGLSEEFIEGFPGRRLDEGVKLQLTRATAVTHENHGRAPRKTWPSARGRK